MDSVRLALRLAGDFKVSGNLLAPLPAGKAVRLLKFLTAARGRFVATEEIIDALWLDEPPNKAERNIAALVSRLRRSLGADRIEGGPSGYRLVLDDNVDVDLFAAEAHLVDAEHHLGRAMYGVAVTAAEAAEQVLGGGAALADEPDAAWVDKLRQRASTLLRRARACRWAAALAMGDAATAVDAATAALADDPVDEEATRALMRAHRSRGDDAAALIAYETLRTTLRDWLGADPSVATRDLYVAVLRNDPVPEPDRHEKPLLPGPSTLLDRAHELDHLRGLWSRAAAGSGGVVVVAGQDGIGKSALADALADEARHSGALVLSTRCFEVERSLYLQPLVEVIRTVVGHSSAAMMRDAAAGWLGTLTELVPELGLLVGQVPYERAEPEFEHHRSLNALVSFFHRLTETRPVLLVVDDFEHAGQSTVEALQFLATRLAHWRMLVVVAERSGVSEPAGARFGSMATTLELGPLSRAAVKAMADRTSLDYDIDELYEWTSGSPLFVTELLRQNDGRATLAIPESLHDAVRDRMTQAGDNVERLLQHGSILGRSFTLETVAALSERTVEDCAAAADRALRAGLLTTAGGTFQFANDVVRQVAYGSVLEPVRISRHRRAATVLADRPEAAAYQLVASQDWRPAALAWLQAADSARLGFGTIDADRLLSQALACAERSEDDRLVAEVHIHRGQVRCERAQHMLARDDHEAALKIALALGDEELEARVLELLGWTALFARDAMAAVELASRARHLAETAVAAPAAMPGALLLLGRVRHWDGDYAGADDAYAEALTSGLDDSTRAMALSYQGALLAHRDQYAAAQETLERAVRLCRRTGAFRPLLQSLFFTALARGNGGDLEGALSALHSARGLLDEYGVDLYRAGIETNLSWLWRELGEPHRAREHADRAVELSRRGGGALELEQELHAQLALADCDLLDGREDDAAHHVEAAAALLAVPLPFRHRATMRLLEMRARWETGAAEELLETARSYSSPKYAA
ncbi:MAG TPA: AAA family ATPase, partial [Actinomycetes bacterium]|nr:AAA family ATPase [Actinomycetes bacterium]